MERQSQLQRFLNQQYSLGRVDSEGNFTVAGDMAAKKLGQSALPSRMSWILKVVQAAVGEPRVKAIDVSVYSYFVDVSLEGDVFWTAESLHNLLDDIQARPPLPVVSLLMAVRDRFEEGNQFLFTFKGWREALYWSGEEVRVEVLEQPADHTLLSVQTGVPVGPYSSVAALQARFNADLSQVLQDNCYLCPIPLTMDGKRVDNLFHVEREEDRFGLVVAWGAEESHIGKMRLPVSIGADHATGLEQLPEELSGLYGALRGSVSPARSGIVNAWFVRANFRCQTRVRDRAWNAVESPSHFLFVKDGVIVDSHPIILPRGHVSLSVVVDASGFIQDLTGFSLVKNDYLETRKKKALEASAKAVSGNKLSIPSYRVEAKSLLDYIFNPLSFFDAKDLVSNPEQLIEEITEGYGVLKGRLEVL